MNETQEKAVKALEAAVRKAEKAGFVVKGTYTFENEHGETVNERLHG